MSLRDKLDYSKVLSKIPIRVSITGTRGKSSLAYLIANALTEKRLWTVAKVTGDVPFFMDRDGVYNIMRKSRCPVFLDETAWLASMCREAKSHPDAVVLENQAIQPYTMFTFHELYSRPNFIIVTNVRRDHQEFLGKRRTDIAAAYGMSFARARRIISGDRDDDTNYVLAKHARRIGASFHTVDMPHEHIDIPGAENVYAAQKLLMLSSEDFPDFGSLSMSLSQISGYVEAIGEMVSLQPSPMGIDWFDGAKLNDIDSTDMVIGYLMRKHPERRFVLMAYFRADRPARTITFAEYFNTMLEEGQVSHIYMAGSGAKYVHSRMRRALRERCSVVKDTIPAATSVVARAESEDAALVTMANAVSPFMRHIRKLLLTESQRHVIYQTTDRANGVSARLVA